VRNVFIVFSLDSVKRILITLAQNTMAMQDDKVLFTEKVSAGKRTYFFDVKEDRQGSKILKITESRKNEGEFIRHSVMVFQEDFEKIFDAFEKSKAFIKTIMPEAAAEAEPEEPTF
jgi:hypothetical protein